MYVCVYMQIRCPILFGMRFGIVQVRGIERPGQGHSCPRSSAHAWHVCVCVCVCCLRSSVCASVCARVCVYACMCACKRARVGAHELKPDLMIVGKSRPNLQASSHGSFCKKMAGQHANEVQYLDSSHGFSL